MEIWYGYFKLAKEGETDQSRQLRSTFAACRKVGVTLKMAVQWSSETFVAEFKDLQVCISIVSSSKDAGNVRFLSIIMFELAALKGCK